MATYVNDLRLKEIATGDESGTWGTSTNTNLELISEALGYGTEAVADASTHTITMADGATDGFRCTFLRLTGGGQVCTVTLAPNTLSHTWIIRNTTSYALTFSQGSGANVIIAAGQAKIVTTDGLGSGAVVYECLEDLELGGTLTVGIDDTGQDVKFFGATSGKYWLWDESADGVVQQGTLTVGVNDTGYDVKFFGATSGSYMLWDESADDLKLVGAAGLTVAGDIDVDGTTNLDAVDIDGATQADGTITVGVDGTGYDVKFFGATSGAYMLWDESADDLKLVGAAGLTVDGASTLTGAVTVGGNVVSDTDSTDSLGSTGVRWLKVWTDTATAGTMTIAGGSITDSSGAISFGNENLTTTGTLASGATTVTGLLAVDQDSDARSIHIDSEATTAQVLDVDAVNTSGNVVDFDNGGNHASGALVQLTQDHASSAADALNIRHDGTGGTLVLNQDGNGIALSIDTEATTVAAVSVLTPTQTTGDVIAMTPDALTTGSALSITSNSSSASVRKLVEIINDHASATATTVLHIQQDADQRSIVIDHNGTGGGDVIAIDSENTTGNVIFIDTPATTTGDVIDLSGADSLTTGRLIRADSNSSSSSVRKLVEIINDHASATATTVLHLQQDANHRSIVIDHNGTGGGDVIAIASENTTGNIIFVGTPATTTGDVIDLSSADSLTTGQLIRADSNSSSTSTRDLVSIVNDNTLATGTTALAVQQDSTGRALTITGDGSGGVLFDCPVVFGTGGTITVATAAITVTSAFHAVGGEGATTDTLSTINGGEDGMVLVLRAASSGYTLTIDNAGNIDLAGGASIAFSNVRHTATFIFSGGTSTWLEISRALNS